MTRSRRIFFIAVILTLTPATSTFADYQAGMTAWQKGDFKATLREFEPFAEKGNIRAQRTLGLMFARGSMSLPRDFDKSLKWLRLAASQGDGQAQSTLGWMYSKGFGVAQNFEAALKWKILAVKNGYFLAQGSIKYLQMEVQSEKLHLKTNPISLDDYKKADIAYENKDYSTAVRLWEPLANQGNVHAQYYLGRVHMDGNVPTDRKAENRWFIMAAKNGHLMSMSLLAMYFEHGLGVPKNVELAKTLRQRAAEKGSPDSQGSLGGKAYHQKDYRTALKWLKLAADQEDVHAQHLLGNMYANGDGVPMDGDIAAKWYRLAGDQGSPMSIRYANKPRYSNEHRFGWTAFHKGDYKTALKFWSTIAKKGYEEAKQSLKKIKPKLVEVGLSRCLYEEVKKISGPESRKIVEDHCRKFLSKKTRSWLLNYVE